MRQTYLQTVEKKLPSREEMQTGPWGKAVEPGSCGQQRGGYWGPAHR